MRVYGIRDKGTGEIWGKFYSTIISAQKALKYYQGWQKETTKEQYEILEYKLKKVKVIK